MKIFKLSLRIALFGLLFALLFFACKEEEVIEDTSITRVSLVGPTVTGSWSDADGNPLPVFMTRFGNTPIFTWEGTLFALPDGYGFKISADANPKWSGRWFLPQGIDDITLINGSEHTMRFSTNGDGGETGAQWRVSKDAKYRIELNTETRLIQCFEIGEAEGGGTDDVFNVMWLIIAEQSAPAPHPMTKVGDNWEITINLNGNTYLKFNGDDTPPTAWGTALVPCTSTRWFYPSSNGVFTEGELLFLYGADNPNAWRTRRSGEYTITLTPSTGIVKFEGVDSGGDTGSKAWLVYTKEITNMTRGDSWQMEGNDGVYTWSGALCGWYKFCVSDNPPTDYEMGTWYGPETDNEAPVSGVEVDAWMLGLFAWQIPIGHYTIVFTPSDEVVTITRNRDIQADDFSEMWVIGTASMLYEGTNYWDAPRNTARRMTPQGNGVYTWAFNFHNDFRHVRVVSRTNGVIFFPDPRQLSAGRGDVQMTAGTTYNMLSYNQAKALLEAAGSSRDPGLTSWQVGAGVNTITINLSTLLISFNSGSTPVNPADGEDAGGSGGNGGGPTEIDTSTVSDILLYGDGATGGTGWSSNHDSPNSILLYTQSNNVFAWIGPLQTGQIKFHNRTADIGPAAYTAVPGNGGTFAVSVDNGGHTFAINAAGTYLIWLDLNAGTASFTVQ